MRTDNVIAIMGRIMGQAHQLISAELAHRGHSGLVPSHGAILANLYEHGPLAMGELARRIHKRKNTVTTLVNKLEQGGYVERSVSPEDSRVALVSLTTKGEEFRPVFKEVSEILLQAVWGSMAEDEKQALALGLARVLRNLESGSGRGGA